MSETLPSACTLHRGDCLEVMPMLAQNSISMIFADFPYGITSCKFDQHMVDLKEFSQRVHKSQADRCIEIYSCVQPFTTLLVSAMLKKFRYDICWQRKTPRGFQSANKRPLRGHETLLVCSNSRGTYNPQKKPVKKVTSHTPHLRKSEVYGEKGVQTKRVVYKDRHPTTILTVDEKDLRHDTLNGHVPKRLHPTQKPVALLEWLIKTYTNEGDTVLDPVFGSCTTGVACARLGRNFIGIEKDAGYFQVGLDRVNAERAQLGLPPAQAHL